MLKNQYGYLTHKSIIGIARFPSGGCQHPISQLVLLVFVAGVETGKLLFIPKAVFIVRSFFERFHVESRHIEGIGFRQEPKCGWFMSEMEFVTHVTHGGSVKFLPVV